MRAIFLTGATGLLGRYVLRNLLQAGRDVAVLVRRGRRGSSARARVDAALRPLEDQLRQTLPRPVPLAGRLEDPGLGLSRSDQEWVARHCSTVVHCAASVTFAKDADTGEPYRSNVIGTRQLLDFCHTIPLCELHHVSTAYVCGDRRGTIGEDEWGSGQRFRNDYERSKFAAEQLVRSADGLESLTVYRPSILVGDSQSGYTSTFHGFYLPLQLAYWATCAGIGVERSGYMAVLGLRGDERKNLVPVDWVAAAIAGIVLRPELHNQTFHLTHPNPLTTAELDAAIGEAIERSRGGANGFAQLPLPSEAPSSLDEFHRQMQVYAGYLSDDPDFDSRRVRATGVGECPRLGHEDLVRLARFAIDAGFGWPRPRTRPVVLDVPSRMDRLPQVGTAPVAATRMQLEISGSYGGVWQVWFDNASLVGVRRGSDPDCDFSGHLNVYTLQDLLRGRQTVPGAMASCRVVLTGSREQLSQGPALIEDVCRCLSGVA